MTSATDPGSSSTRAARGWRVAAWMTVLIGAFALLREHWAHVLGYWPYLLLLACPLMHLFGHRHGDDAGHRHA
jgi:hypothetical protein